MLIDLIKTAAQVIIILTVMQLIKVKLLDRDPDSAIGAALAFING